MTDGLLIEGTQREVTHATLRAPAVIECFTITETAKALGKSEPNIRRWLREDLIPAPRLYDTNRELNVYSVGELQILANLFAEHEQEFSYYTVNHQDLRNRMFKEVGQFRDREL